MIYNSPEIGTFFWNSFFNWWHSASTNASFYPIPDSVPMPPRREQIQCCGHVCCLIYATSKRPKKCVGRTYTHTHTSTTGQKQLSKCCPYIRKCRPNLLRNAAVCGKEDTNHSLFVVIDSVFVSSAAFPLTSTNLTHTHTFGNGGTKGSGLSNSLENAKGNLLDGV